MTARACQIAAIVAVLLPIGGGAASAQGAPAGAQPASIGAFKDWNAYSAPVKGGKVCYALATPEAGRRRAAQPPSGAYFFISNRPQDGVQNEISVTPGFGLKAGSDVEVIVDRDSFKLFVRGAEAFMNSNEDQTALVAAMRGGHGMRIKATPARGRQATQSYSLAGVGAALDKINQECRAAAAPPKGR